MRKSVTFRLKETTRQLLDAQARQEDLSRTAMIELLVKEGAKQRGIEIPRKDAYDIPTETPPSEIAS
jgi:hypothetical protein